MKPEPETPEDKIAVKVSKPAPKAETPAAPKRPAAPTGRVFDVTRPGKTPASPTSRPVITGHKPSVSNTISGMSGIGDAKPLLDPKHKSVAPAAHKEETEPPGAPPVPTKKEMPKDKLAASAPEPPVESEAVEPAHTEPTTAPELTSASVAEPEKPAAAVETPATTEPDAAAQPEPEAPALATMSAPAAPATHRSTLAEEIDPLEDLAAPDLKQNIVVSQHSGGASALKVLLILIVIVMLGVVAFDIALDAGIVDIQGVPHTRLLPQ